MVEQRLWVSLILSVLLHVLLCLSIAGSFSDHDFLPQRLEISFRGVAPAERGHRLFGQSESLPTKGEGGLRQQIGEFHSSKMQPGTAKRMVVTGSELDELPKPDHEPVLEPDYGFADDVEGSVTLMLLVNPEGRVVFDLIEQNDLDESTTRYLRDQLGVLVFAPPRYQGKAVYAWVTFVVTIRQKDL